MESLSIHYIFGDRLFIGYTRFYNKDRNLGFVVSNNVGMKDRREFRHKYNDFYIDESSFDDCVHFDKLVIFRPAYVKGRLKALNVRQYDEDIDKIVAIKTILDNNIIEINNREREIIPAGRSGVSYGHVYYKQDINIYKLSGIKSYELLEECYHLLKDDNKDSFTRGIDSFISVMGGDRKYYYKLKESDANEGNDSKLIKRIFSITGQVTATNIILRHPSFQLVAPFELLKNLVGKLNEDYYIPAELISEHCEKKLQGIINDNSVFSTFYKDERERKRYIRNRLIRLLNRSHDINRESLSLEITKQIKEGIEKYIKNINDVELQEKFNFLEFFRDYLSVEQKEKVLASIHAQTNNI